MYWNDYFFEGVPGKCMKEILTYTIHDNINRGGIYRLKLISSMIEQLLNIKWRIEAEFFMIKITSNVE